MNTFKESLLIQIEKRGLSLLEVSKGSSVSYEQLKKLKQGKSRSTNIDDALRIADYFGMDIKEFIGLEEESIQHRINLIVRDLLPESRVLLEKVATAQLAAQHLDDKKSELDD